MMFGPDLSAPDFWWLKTPTPTARLLSPIGALYGWLTMRRMGRAPKGTANIPVLCVGNLVMGGAGKTPTSFALLQEFKKLGHNPGILLRGFGGSETGPLQVKPEHSVDQVGDEAMLYANVAPTIISSDRVAGANLLAQTGVDVILMDDGFQNPSLYKDMSLVVVDVNTAWGNGLCCPAGPLRAPVKSQLQHASAIIALGEGTRIDEIKDAAKRVGISIYHGEIVADPVSHSFAKQRFIAYSGIGRPEKFFKSLTDANLDVAESIAFPDHHVFTEKDSEKILSRCRSREAIPITTKKDYVRLLAAADHTFSAELRQATQVLNIRVEWEFPERVIQMLCRMMNDSDPKTS